MRIGPANASRSLALLVAAALLWATNSGLAQQSARDPISRVTPGDQRLASSLLVRQSDLLGWRVGDYMQKVPPSGPVGASRCRGFDPDLRDLVETGWAISSYARGPGPRQIVNSLVVVFANRSMLAEFWRRAIRDEAARCIASNYNKENARRGSRPKMAVRRLDLTSGSPLTAGWRLTITGLRFQGPTYSDEIWVARGRALVNLSVASIGAPPAPSLTGRLAELIARRLARA